MQYDQDLWVESQEFNCRRVNVIFTAKSPMTVLFPLRDSLHAVQLAGSALRHRSWGGGTRQQGTPGPAGCFSVLSGSQAPSQEWGRSGCFQRARQTVSIWQLHPSTMFRETKLYFIMFGNVKDIRFSSEFQ